MQLLLSERYCARQFTCINLSSPYEVSTNYYSQHTSEENRPQRSYAGELLRKALPCVQVQTQSCLLSFPVSHYGFLLPCAAALSSLGLDCGQSYDKSLTFI